uniref:RNA-directed RNA polymerase n=1 Tax=Acrobeloides nanus TaxID=290746 RepID=A0A914BY28_9BILA
MKAVGSMKIVVRHVPVQKFEELASKLVEELLNHKSLHDTIPDLQFELASPQPLGDLEEGDYRIEFHLEVSAADLPSNFTHLFGFFLEYARKQELHFYAKYKVPLCISYVIKNEGFFTILFTPAHLNMPTREIQFGNIVENSRFLSHKVVEPDLNLVHIINRSLGSIARNNQLDAMFTSMEHDRRSLIVKFPFQKRGKDPKDPKFNFEAVVNLSSKYSNFRRIIIDLVPYKKTLPGNIHKLYTMKIYFHLIWPMTVKMYKFFNDKKNNPNADEANRLGFQHGDRYPSWEDTRRDSRPAEEINESPAFMIHLKALDDKTCSDIIGRLCVITERRIEFRHLNIVDSPLINRALNPMRDEFWSMKLKNETKFSFLYLLSALLSRGSVVKDHILSTKEARDKFLYTLLKSYNSDKLQTHEAMERLLNEVDEKLEVGDLSICFERIKTKMIANPELLQQIYEDNKKEGYVRVRKIIITPTRLLYVVPELLMSNRVLRKYDLDGEKALRVLFRDDDGSKIHSNNVSKYLIDRTVGDYLRRGVNVAGKHFVFLGSSNSQLRDNGCYFFEGSSEEVAKMRRDLGQFKMQSVPKIMSRIGQCFTQARQIDIELLRHQYTNTYDYIGGQDRNGKPYTFSDGVGIISYYFAENISKSLEMAGSVPSVFQIRFRGFKGVMSVDLMLDDKKKWGREHNIEDPNPEFRKWLYLDAIFRPSQEKFRAPRATLIEIVKHSAPVPVSLNKPLINIIDQVSSMQSHSSHSRISNRIHWLLDRHLHELTRCLIDEQKCRNKLNEFPKLILYDQLTDFNLTQEPFFRSLIQTSSRCSLKRMLNKLQIPIPLTLGRSMFGIIDETGELQYGQVYVRYTKNASLKFPGKNAERVTLIGPIFVTKNPCIVPGDIRMFEAIDVPGLYHLSDVIVFPRHGPRPHTDEMAGSDLDGDEYTVIWDEQLFIDRNEKAFDFTSDPVEPEVVTEENLTEKMCEFFVTYMEQDSIGKIANAFINNSDQYGIESEVCKNIALKHNKAVDFPKTGIAPPTLTNKWKDDIPPEKCERWADFMEKSHEPAYSSPRLIGQLFRRVKIMDDILKLVSKESEQLNIRQDPFIEYPGWEDYEEDVAVEYESYAAQLQSLMDSYSIQEEGELFSSCFISLKNRVSDRDQDDMSLYNTATIIEQRLSTIFGRFRRAFYERFGDFHALTTIDMHRTSREHKEVFRRVCLEPSEEMKQMACAYYKVAYYQDVRGSKRFLSFAWLVWDVINEFRRERLYHQAGISSISFDPLSDSLCKHIAEVIDANNRSFQRFCEKAIEESVALKRYCLRHQGLAELLFFCYKWGRKHHLFSGSFNVEHLCLTVILFGLNKLQTENFETTVAWLDETDQMPSPDQSPLNLNEQRGGIGRKFLMLIEFLSTRQFEKIKKLDFLDAGLECYSFFIEREWVPLHQLALKTFNQIAFTNRFESLPCVEGIHDEHLTKKDATFVEAEPFVIEVPATHRRKITSEMTDKLIHKTGCMYIVTRDIPRFGGSETARLVVSSYGTIEANQKLRDLLTVRPNTNSGVDCRQRARMLAAQVYERLNVD